MEDLYMSFTKLDMNDNSQVEGRACVIIYNIGGKELKSIKGYASLLGVRDQIVLYPKNADTVVKDILENNINSDCSNGRKEKVNTYVSSSMKTAIKKFEKDVKSGNVEAASLSLNTAIQRVDKAKKAGLVHQNKAARVKSRLTKLKNAMK